MLRIVACYGVVTVNYGFDDGKKLTFFLYLWRELVLVNGKGPYVDDNCSLAGCCPRGYCAFVVSVVYAF